MKKEIIIALVCLILVIGMAYVLADDSATMTVNVLGVDPVINSVTVNDAIPTAGTTTQIKVTTQITDTNGVDDITEVSAVFTTGAPDNGNNVTTMMRSACTNIDTDTIECNATYDMQFYDPSGTYTIEVTAEDSSAGDDADSDDFSYDTLLALDLDASTIAFGSLTVGNTGTVTGDGDIGTAYAPTVKNQGNQMLDVGMQGTDLTIGTDTITVGNAGYRFDTGSYTAMSASKVVEDVNIVVGALSTNKIDFQLTIPVGSLPGNYSGTVYVTAE